MHDGAVRPGSGDGGKRNVLQRAGVAAECFQRLDRIDLGQRAGRGFAIDPGKEARQRHRVARVCGPGAFDLGGVLDGLEQADRIVAPDGLATRGRYQAAQRVSRGGAIERDRSAALRKPGEFRRQRIGLGDIGRVFEMIARAVRQFAVIDEDDGAAVLRHQRIGQRQRRMRDVGAADVEGPRHRVRIRQHQRVDAKPHDFEANALELVGFRFARKLAAVNGDRAQRRRRALGPHGIERVAVDRDQFRARLGAGRRQPLRCRRSVQPRVKSEAVAGCEMLRQPAFRRRIDQRLDAPRRAVDLFCRLERIAAVDEHRGRLRQNDREAGRTGKAGEPGEPLFRGRDIFVLLLIGAGNYESGQLAPRQFLAKGGQPRPQRHAAFRLFECLEISFEHRLTLLGLRGEVRNVMRIGPIWHILCLSCSSRIAGFVAQAVHPTISGGKFQECLNASDEGMHHADVHI